MELQQFEIQQYVDLLEKHGLVKETHIVQSGKVGYVSCNSQDVKPDTLFICKGAHFKEKFLSDAVSAGAVWYFSETKMPVDASYVLVSDIRKTMALCANLFYNEPAKKMNLIGITGTKGKSTTTYYVKYILDEYLKAQRKVPSAYISSIDTYDGVEKYESHLTTPESMDLQKHFFNAVQSGIEYCEMEVSSQALKYDRVLGVTFDVACFLNIDKDHISPIEHPNFEDYFSSKLRIFSQAKTACVNLDSNHAEEILAAASASQRVITFGTTSEADVYGYQVKKDGNDTVFRVKTSRFHREFRLTMPGLFNVQNALAAIAICEALQIPEHYIYIGLMKARVSGRMEIYSSADNRVIAIVDYAHNRLSFEKLFHSVKEEYPGRRIIITYGCPGKKALDRRKDLAEVAGKNADQVIITEEDAGEEPLMDICKEIATHVEEQKCDYSIVPDRGEAIQSAIVNAQQDTIVLITGKGNETRQKRGIEYIPTTSDVAYVKQYLHEYDLEHHLDGMEKVSHLIDLMPMLHKLEGKVIVIKYGGSAWGDEKACDTMLQDMAALKMIGAKLVVVHGGGKAITSWLSKMHVDTKFVGGYRVTDSDTLHVAEMVLSGLVNKSIVRAFHGLGVNAVGISGSDGSLLTATKKKIADGDLGFVGEISAVDTSVIETLLENDFVPVISPIGVGTDGQEYNVNADDAACEIASALHADQIDFLTDVNGILIDSNNRQTVLPHLTTVRAKELIETGLIVGGMIPKVNNCIHAIENHVKKAVVLDGRVPHSILLESITEKANGTIMTE